MKKVMIGFMIVGSLLQAKPYTQQDRITDMTTMAQAMNTIQSGFFYNNYETLEVGVESLTEAIEHVRPTEAEKNQKDIMEQYMDKKFQMTNKIVKKINRKALTILERFKSGDSVQAAQAYIKIMNQCMKCHKEIRNW